MSVQLIIIIAYFALTVAISMLSGCGGKGSASFHGAGLSITMVVCASAGEWLGGTSTTGVSEYGFDFGLSGSWYTIANGIGVIFLALLFARLYRSLNTVTVPGIIGKFLGVKARTVSSVFLTFVMLAVGISQMIAAGSLGVSLMGLDFNISIVAFAAVFIVYTLIGGMKSVAYTNVMHLFFMYGGILLAIILALSKVGGIGQVVSALPPSYFSMTAIGGSKVSSWVIASLLGACTAQAGIQPILASRDVPSARKAAIITAFVAAPFGLFTALLGMISKTMSLNGTLLDTAGNVVTNGKLALPTLMMNLSPVAGGIVLDSLLSAFLSTVSPIILASGTMLTKDIYQGVIKKDATEKEVLRFSRVTTAVSGVICAAVAILFNSLNLRVLDIVYFAYSMRGALFVIVLLGIYWKSASERGAVAGMLATAAVGGIWVVYNGITGRFPIHPALNETYIAIITALITTVVFSLIWKNGKKDPLPQKSS